MCGESASRSLFRVSGFTVHRCATCGGGFVSPLPGASDLQMLYDDEYGADYMSGPMHEQASAAARYTQVNGTLRSLLPRILDRPDRRVLDVGCGSGRFLACLRDSGWTATGVEISPRLMEFARQQLALDVEPVDFLRMQAGQGYDLVTMFHIIEHFADPNAAIRKACAVLRRGGALFVETPNWEGLGARLAGYRWSSMIPPKHVVFFGPRSLRRLAEANGLRTLLCQTTMPPVVQSLERIPPVARPILKALYRASSLAGSGPEVQYLGVLEGQA
jgi:2-polyprenyl-3-methyl-5-hydroxy-6-metoxy-1,4-benzoquinol methylase